ncbi:MAG: hypothetical protein ACRDBG_11140 [Waterburya sp.]
MYEYRKLTPEQKIECEEVSTEVLTTNEEAIASCFREKTNFICCLDLSCLITNNF